MRDNPTVFYQLPVSHKTGLFFFFFQTIVKLKIQIGHKRVQL